MLVHGEDGKPQRT